MEETQKEGKWVCISFSEGVYNSRVNRKKEVKESENIPVAEFHNFL